VERVGIRGAVDFLRHDVCLLALSEHHLSGGLPWVRTGSRRSRILEARFAKCCPDAKRSCTCALWVIVTAAEMAPMGAAAPAYALPENVTAQGVAPDLCSPVTEPSAKTENKRLDVSHRMP
jgi:hypothetical protein